MRITHMLTGCLGVVLLSLGTSTCGVPIQQGERWWKFQDDFSTRKGGWPTGSTKRADQYGYADGRYRILIRVEEGQVGSGQIAGIPLTRNGRASQALEVEVDTIQKSGPAATLRGVACGTSPTELYFFLINLAGYYFIVRDEAGTANTDLLRMGRASAPFRGIGETNRMGAQCTGTQQETILTLEVNGEKVGEARDHRGKTFDRAMFVVTTLHAIANSTRTTIPGVNAGHPGSPTAFEAEILFDNFVARVR